MCLKGSCLVKVGFDDKELVAVPKERALEPSRDALAWHMNNVFKAA